MHGRHRVCLCVSACDSVAVQVTESTVYIVITAQIYCNVCSDGENLETSVSLFCLTF